MKERILEVIEYCIVLIVAIIEVLFMMVLTPFYPFIYIITGKNIYKKN